MYVVSSVPCPVGCRELRVAAGLKNAVSTIGQCRLSPSEVPETQTVLGMLHGM